MEKLQTLLWIVLGLGIFIWRMVQKARATTQQEQQERKYSRPDSTGRPRPVVPLPTTSFEELLRQMQADNRTAEPAPTFAETTPGGRPMPREATPTAHSLERPNPEAKSLETSSEARSLEVPLHEARRASRQPRTAVQHGQEDYWSRQAAQAQRPPRASVTDMLRNPADLRAAFVLSEILKRKF